MLLVELECAADSHIEIQRLLYHRSSVVVVRCPVDLTAFHHHEERSLFLLKETDGGVGYLGKGEVARLTVDGVGDTAFAEVGLVRSLVPLYEDSLV